MTSKINRVIKSDPGIQRERQKAKRHMPSLDEIQNQMMYPLMYQKTKPIKKNTEYLSIVSSIKKIFKTLEKAVYIINK